MAVVGKSILGNDLEDNNTKLKPRLEMLFHILHAETFLRYKINPNERFTIWYGRILGYGERIQKAREVFTDGIARFPGSYRLYRHRGHRYLSHHKVHEALTDFKKSVELFEAAGAPVEEMEADGVKHRLPIPPETTGFNIYYHCAVAAYLCDDLPLALDMNKKTFNYCINDEDIVAASDWGYLIRLRIGNKKEADELISKISDTLNIEDNVGYYRRIKFYKGLLSYEDMCVIRPEEADEYHRPMVKISQLYGVAAYYIYTGEIDRGLEILRECVKENTHFGAFAQIAAEHDIKAFSGVK